MGWQPIRGHQGPIAQIHRDEIEFARRYGNRGARGHMQKEVKRAEPGREVPEIGGKAMQK